MLGNHLLRHQTILTEPLSFLNDENQNESQYDDPVLFQKKITKQTGTKAFIFSGITLKLWLL